MLIDFFFVILSVALTLGFCWIADRENFSYHVVAMFLVETCTIFWIILPR